jgi:flagellar motility protein MotE (MotC chaperone)
MADQDKKEDELRGAPAPERRIPEAEQEVRFRREQEKSTEAKEISQGKIVSEELKREIEMMELDEDLKVQAAEKAKKIQLLGEEEKIDHLLKLAQEKGVVFAVKVAKSMNDPYILDTLHDILAREGYYQKFIK